MSIFRYPIEESVRGYFSHQNLYSCKSNSKKLSISFLIVRNREFDEEIPFNSFSKCLSKCSHPLFHISCQPKIDNENGFLECTQDIEKLLESESIQKVIFMHKAIQIIIQIVKFRKTLGDSLSLRERLNGPLLCEAGGAFWTIQKYQSLHVGSRESNMDKMTYSKERNVMTYLQICEL